MWIASASVLAIAAPNKASATRNQASSLKITGTPGRIRPGVFACLFFISVLYPASLYAENTALCTPLGKLESVQLEQVVDGDTLRLRDGRRVRLIGINTPEIGRDGRADQPLADTARRVANDWLAGETLLLEMGTEARDRHGRYLASVFRSSDRRMLGEYLLTQGLGWQVTVPPNSVYTSCLQQAEAAARAARRGVWADKRYPVLKASALVPADAGFQRVRGRVSTVTDSRRERWIELDRGVSLRLERGEIAAFGDMNFDELVGKVLTVRGWLIYRGRQPRGYPPYLMHLQHPAMLEAIEE